VVETTIFIADKQDFDVLNRISFRVIRTLDPRARARRPSRSPAVPSDWSGMAAPDLRFPIVIDMIPAFALAYHSDG
jgi:hypothetical protein